MPTAYYRLDELKKLVRDGKYAITATAQKTALALGFDDEDICRCVVEELRESHLYKSMPAEKAPGLMQDVYKITFEGVRLYVKLQRRTEKCVMVSFKEDESV